MTDDFTKRRRSNRLGQQSPTSGTLRGTSAGASRTAMPTESRTRKESDQSAPSVAIVTPIQASTSLHDTPFYRSLNEPIDPNDERFDRAKFNMGLSALLRKLKSRRQETELHKSLSDAFKSILPKDDDEFELEQPRLSVIGDVPFGRLPPLPLGKTFEETNIAVIVREMYRHGGTSSKHQLSSYLSMID